MVTSKDNKPTELRVEADDASRFRDYADADADWFWELDPNLRFAIVSKRHEGRSSVHEKDLLGKTPWEFADADPGRDPLWAAFLEKLERREVFRGFRIAIRSLHDGVIYWRLSGKPVLSADGVFLGYRGIATDETVEAILRANLQAQSGDYQTALEMLEEGIAFFDTKERLILANTTFRRFVPASHVLMEPGTTFEKIISHFKASTMPDNQSLASRARSGAEPFQLITDTGQTLDAEARPLPSGNMALVIKKHPLPQTPKDNYTGNFKSFIDASPQAFYVHKDGKFVYANSAAAEIFGYPLNEFLDINLWDLFDPEELPRLQAFYRARSRGDDAPERFRVKGVSADGSMLHLEYFVSVGKWDGEDTIQVFLQDRSPEYLAESARNNSELKFQNLVEGSLQGYFVHRDWKILYANAAAAKTFGYDVEEFIGTSFLDLASPEEHDLLIDIRRRRLTGDENVPGQYEIQCVRKDGKPLTIEVSARIIKWDGATAFQATMLDISQQKEFERHLVNAKEDAERADRSKTEFLGNMSHELRTPLNAIIGFSQLIKDQILGTINAHYIDYAGAIHSSGMHLLELVNDLLDVASIENGALALSDDDVDLVELGKMSERMLRPRAQKAELLISVDAHEPSLHVRGDDRRLKQIFINLANNAIKFTKPGGHVVLRILKDDKGRAVIEVEDNGIGISEEDQKIIFDPFTRVHTTYVAEREGTGLGLPLVRALTELHNGSIELESAVDEGTKISVILPAERVIPPKA